MRRFAARSGVATSLALASVFLLTSTAVASWVQNRTSTQGRSIRTIDGDTELVDVWGDGTSTGKLIRNSGIQAMEVGQCHSSEATRNMNLLTLRKHVRLTSKYARAVSLGRPIRYVDVLTSAGWVDTQLRQLQAGHALPLVLIPESGRWRTHWIAAEKAALAGKNLWDPDYCRSGPSQATPLKVWVNYDGDGNESNVNTEYVRVLNQGSTTLSLRRWWLRSGAQDSYFFPSTAVIKPHAYITLHVGKGTRTATKFYWGSSVSRFKDVERAGGYGDGAYLFDPDGDLRAHATYPCLYGCADARAGKLSMSVNYDAPGDDARNVNGESVTVTNRSSTMVDLSYTVLASNGNTLELGAGTVLYPGERMVTRVGFGTSSRLLHYWRHSLPMLTNAGGAVTLRTTETTRLVCSDWGTGRC
jgi:endonuclease YncB( thermonuclease family)